MPVLAVNFDTSLDDEIRKNYNPNKIEADMALPALPKIINGSQNVPGKPPEKPAVRQIKKSTAPAPQKYTLEAQLPPATAAKFKQAIYSENYATLKAGTKINVKLLSSISDKTPKGTKISFVSQYPVSTTYFTIPIGTVFNGRIGDSHRPQLAGNGGLIVIDINSLTLNDGTHPISAYVTTVNYKNVFFNNIKGKRNYLNGMVKSTAPGRHFFGKMLSITANLARDGSSIILSPFSLGLGVIILAGNVIASPALALFYKGGSVYIKEGANFEIKLLDDMIIYK